MDDVQTILGVMRAQAWERAKGELRSIIVSYVADKERFDHMSKAFELFETEVDNYGLAE